MLKNLVRKKGKNCNTSDNQRKDTVPKYTEKIKPKLKLKTNQKSKKKKVTIRKKKQYKIVSKFATLI